jgi:hypothetical protein
MSDNKNGAPPPQAPRPVPQGIPAGVNFDEIAPGVWRLHAFFGFINITIDLPEASAEQLADTIKRQIAAKKTRIVLAPADALPTTRKPS